MSSILDAIINLPLTQDANRRANQQAEDERRAAALAREREPIIRQQAEAQIERQQAESAEARQRARAMEIQARDADIFNEIGINAARDPSGINAKGGVIAEFLRRGGSPAGAQHIHTIQKQDAETAIKLSDHDLKLKNDRLETAGNALMGLYEIPDGPGRQQILSQVLPLVHDAMPGAVPENSNFDDQTLKSMIASVGASKAFNEILKSQLDQRKTQIDQRKTQLDVEQKERDARIADRAMNDPAYAQQITDQLMASASPALGAVAQKVAPVVSGLIRQGKVNEATNYINETVKMGVQGDMGVQNKVKEFDALTGKRIAEARQINKERQEGLLEGTGVTPEDLKAEAVYRAITGEKSTRGFSPTVNAAILHEQNQWLKESGLTQGDRALMGAAFKGNAGAMSDLMKRSARMDVFENTALKNLDLAGEILKTQPDLGSKLLNKPLREVRTLLSADKAAALDNAMRVAGVEVQQVITSGGNSGVLTVFGQQEAKRLLSPELTIREFFQIVPVLKQDMQNRKTAFADAIKGISKKIQTVPGDGAAPAQQGKGKVVLRDGRFVRE